MIKREVDRFRGNFPAITNNTSSVPIEVMTGNETVVTNNTSNTNDTKLVEKNDRLISFLSVFFSRPQYDRNGDITSLLPADLTDDALELLSSTSTTSDQAGQLADALTSIASEISTEKHYLSRAANLPHLSQTVLLYILKTTWHNGAIDKSIDSIKKSFNLLALLPPPNKTMDEYDKYISSSRNTEIEEILNQPSEKRSAVKKEIFIKGRQESLKDFVSYIANIVVFARFWVKMDDEPSSQPTVLQMLIEIADYVSTSDYESFHETHASTKNYMPHTLIAYAFNITSVFVKMAKNRKRFVAQL